MKYTVLAVFWLLNKGLNELSAESSTECGITDGYQTIAHVVLGSGLGLSSCFVLWRVSSYALKVVKTYIIIYSASNIKDILVILNQQQ